MFECYKPYSIREMISLRRQIYEGKNLALVIQENCSSQKCEFLLLQEFSEKKFGIRNRGALKGYRDSLWSGELAEVKNGVACIQSETSILNVWRACEPGARQFHIPGGECQLAGMAVMEDVLDGDEMLALAFWNKKSIGFFSIQLSGLVQVRDVQLEFNPYALLWIAGKQTLLIGDRNGNDEQICALRVTDCDVTSYTVTLEGKQRFAVLRWCVLPDMRGNESAIAIYDCESSSVKLFELA